MAALTFRVAFSFPGEARHRLGPIAAILDGRVGRGSVFYDEWDKAELARPDLDLHLPPATNAPLETRSPPDSAGDPPSTASNSLGSASTAS